MTYIENAQKSVSSESYRPKPSTEKMSSNRNVANGNKDLRLKRYFLPPTPAPGTCYLVDLASVVRSKNAGPYELTFDIMFRDDSTYMKVQKCGLLNQATVAKLYDIAEEDVIACLFWDPALAFRATIKRLAVSGGYGETDTHGSRLHAPFLYLVLPIPKVSL
jgi:hypothetical protein